MARRKACLVDVYDTLLSCDLRRTGPNCQRWPGSARTPRPTGTARSGAALGLGQLTKAEGFGKILTSCGVEARPGLVRALVDRDRELLLASARLYDDALQGRVG